MPTHIALLRGINLGPAKRVAMADLRALCEQLGYEDVRTLVNSGNVVLRGKGSPRKLERELEKAIADELRVEVPVVARTRDELADVVERNPFPEAAAEPKRVQVSFVSGKPDAAFVRKLEEQDFAPERFVVSGREIYAWHPDGLQRSNLGRVLVDKRLGATARNWNTVTKLLEMADEG
jgi:uncharacterized protein (DUF1697 family)